MIVETEAYHFTEPAAHSFAGLTERTRVMFESPPGTAYVYRSYGMHWCVNVVCAEDGRAAAVLLRAGRVVDGLDVARERRPGVPDLRLARGPGCLSRALGLTQAFDGRELVLGSAAGRPDADTPVLTARSAEPQILCGPRVGISRAQDELRRFWVSGDATVSAYRRGGRVRPAGR